MASTWPASASTIHVLLLLLMLQLHGIMCTRSLTSTAATNNSIAVAEVLAKLESSKAALQSLVNSNFTHGSLDGKNMTQIDHSKRIASIVNLVGADVAYILWAALSISANSFSLLSFVAASDVSGEVNIDIAWLAQFAALVAGVQAEVADLMSSIEGLVADAKGGISIVLGMKTSG